MPEDPAAAEAQPPDRGPGPVAPPPAEVAPECVKVCVRVRPLNSKENSEGSVQCVKFPSNNEIIIGKDRRFTFDNVFEPDDGQDEVYSRTALPLVDKVMEGFNATVLAYGQTASGKTHTMGSACGDGLSPEHVGVIPRAMDHFFKRKAEKEAAGDKIEISVEFLEIYQEECYDLLSGTTKEDGQKGLPIREEDGLVYVAGATSEPVKCADGALECLSRGTVSRSVGETLMNSVSSRSHAIFSITVKCTGERNTTSKLHFVDLAGSERAKRTAAEGIRMKEGININQVSYYFKICSLGEFKRHCCRRHCNAL